MKPLPPQAFDRNHAEAARPLTGHDAHVIRAQMNRSDWLTLGLLALIWGGAFFFIGVAVRHVPQLACVTASLSYALAAVWARRFRRQGISPLSVTTGQLTAGALMMLPVSMIVDRPWTHAFPPLTAIGAITALALFCTAFGYVLYFRLIATSGATNALLVTLLVPPVAILLGGLFLNETLAPQDFLGLALIALGLAAIDGRVLSLFRRASPPQAA